MDACEGRLNQHLEWAVGHVHVPAAGADWWSRGQQLDELSLLAQLLEGATACGCMFISC